MLIYNVLIIDSHGERDIVTFTEEKDALEFAFLEAKKIAFGEIHEIWTAGEKDLIKEYDGNDDSSSLVSVYRKVLHEKKIPKGPINFYNNKPESEFAAYKAKYPHVPEKQLRSEWEDNSGDLRNSRICSENGNWP